jgi:hypothetical protein
MPLHEPRRYNHYARDRSGKTTLLRSFDTSAGVGQTGTTVTLYGNDYGDIRAVVKLRPGEWGEAVAWAPRVIDAPSS